MPRSPGSSPVIWDYDRMRRSAARLSPFTPLKLDEDSALELAAKSPYPEAVKLGVRKHLANGEGITLRQLAIILGWAARRAQAGR